MLFEVETSAKVDLAVGVSLNQPARVLASHIKPLKILPSKIAEDAHGPARGLTSQSRLALRSLPQSPYTRSLLVRAARPPRETLPVVPRRPVAAPPRQGS